MAVTVVDSVTRIWQPHKRQEDYIRIPDSVFEAMYGGAAGGGKSELLIMLPIIRGWHNSPRFHGIIFRETFPQLEESIIPRANEFYRLAGANYNETKHVWKFPSGATIRASYLEKEKDAREHDTAEYNYAAFDELTAFREFIYRYITSRVRSSDPSLPAIVRSATNPGNKGHVWVRKRFVDPARQGNVIIFDKLSKTKRIFIPASLDDNPHLSENDPGYKFRLEILPEAERRAKIYGDWYVFSGQVFEEWRLHPLGGEPASAQHVVKPFEIPSWWPKILAIDWGFTAKTWAGWAAVAPDARAYLYREYTAHKKAIEVWGADVARISQPERNEIVEVVLDPSAWNQRGDPHTIAQQFEQATGWRPNKADNDRLGGKMLMHEMLRWTPKPPKKIPPEGFDPTKAQELYRRYGEEAHRRYCEYFKEDDPETNLPKLQVFETCTSFIETIPICVYDSKDGEVAEDVAEFDGDDPYDGGRYLIKAVDRYVKMSWSKDQKVQSLNRIMTRFAETGDYNVLHRQMEAYEHLSPKVVGIHRGRRRGRHFVTR